MDRPPWTNLDRWVVGLGLRMVAGRLLLPRPARATRGPRCEACASRRGRGPTIAIAHEPGEEIQWDWVELAGAPWDDKVHLLNGTLSYAGKTRGVIAEVEDQAHLIEAIDGVLRRLGGTPGRWRFDRMSTVMDRQGKLLPGFAPPGSPRRTAHRCSARSFPRPSEPLAP